MLKIRLQGTMPDADLNDKDQTVFHPEIRTSAMDVNGRSELVRYSTKFYDVVTYDNLESEKQYKLVGIAMDKNTGEELILNGKTVTAEQVFTTGASNKKNGAVQDSFTLEFTIMQDMQDDLPGKDMVIYETLYVQNGKTWYIAAEHKDLNDEGQELKVPTIKTTLLDRATKTHVAYPNQIVTLVDTVEYTNLIPGKKYTMEGMLMKQPKDGENREIFNDENGKPVCAVKDFVASETGCGVVELTFTFNAKELYVESRSVVAFENCIPEGDLIPVATHADIHDMDQTVDFPKVGTTASQVLQGEQLIVTDVIHYENLTAGYSYTAKGTLVNQDGTPVVVNGVAIVKEVTFTPASPNGEISVTFPAFNPYYAFADTDKRKEYKYVVFEEVYLNRQDENGRTVPDRRT